MNTSSIINWTLQNLKVFTSEIISLKSSVSNLSTEETSVCINKGNYSGQNRKSYSSEATNTALCTCPDMSNVYELFSPLGFGTLVLLYIVAEPSNDSWVCAGFHCTTISGKLHSYIKECLGEFLFSDALNRASNIVRSTSVILDTERFGTRANLDARLEIKTLTGANSDVLCRKMTSAEKIRFTQET